MRKRIGRPRRNEGANYMLRGVPPRQWTSFRVVCGKRGKSARAVLLDFIQRSISSSRRKRE